MAVLQSPTREVTWLIQSSLETDDDTVIAEHLSSVDAIWCLWFWRARLSW